MGKLHIVSDLHLCHAPCAPLEVLGDILILAGDIVDSQENECYARLENVIVNYILRDLPCILIPGNHEFYGLEYTDALNMMTTKLKKMGITVLYNEVFEYQDMIIFGATLWTNFELYDTQDLSMVFAQRYLADYKNIRFCTEQNEVRMLEPKDTLDLHNQTTTSMRFRLMEITKKKIIIVTHHAPHRKSIHRKFKKNRINAAFISDLSELINEISPSLWIHGHCHQSFDYVVGTTRIIANPRGYAADGKSENLDFKVDCVVNTSDVIEPVIDDLDTSSSGSF